MYGFCDENSGIVLREYQHWYSDQRHPIRYLFAVVGKEVHSCHQHRLAAADTCEMRRKC
jgi:hypothetical protein